MPEASNVLKGEQENQVGHRIKSVIRRTKVRGRKAEVDKIKVETREEPKSHE